MTSCQYKQSTEQYALFKNKVHLLKNFSQKLILTVLSNFTNALYIVCNFNSLMLYFYAGLILHTYILFVFQLNHLP
jgi:hypothetical protein